MDLYPAAPPGGSAITTTGETLTVSIGYPGDGWTEYGRTTAFIQGAATLRGGSGEHTSVTQIAVGFGDAYEAPGSTYVGDATREYEGWRTDGQLAFQGTRKVYITAIAADGTRATANATFTVDSRRPTRLTAYGALYDWRLPSGWQPALRASLYQLGQFGEKTPVSKAKIIFYAGNERVCTAWTGPSAYAVCSDPGALAKVVAGNEGYTAVFADTDALFGSTAWGPTALTESTQVP